MLEFNENVDTTYQNFWDILKAVLRRKFIVLIAHMKKQENYHTREFTGQLKALEHKEANTPERSRCQEILKLRAEINKLETRRIQRINETKSWFFEKINRIDKPLSSLTKQQRVTMQIDKIRNEMGEITTDTEEIQRIIGSYFKNLYSSKFENIKEMARFYLPKLNQEQISNFNRPITTSEIEAVIRNLLTNKRPGPNGFSAEFYQKFKEQLTLILLKVFHTKEAEGPLSTFLHEASITLIPKSHKNTTEKENYRPISLMNIEANYSIKYWETKSRNIAEK